MSMKSIIRGLAVALLALIIGVSAVVAYRYHEYFRLTNEWRQNLGNGVTVHQRHYESFGGDFVFTQTSTYPSTEDARSAFEAELREASEIVERKSSGASAGEIVGERAVIRSKPNRHGAWWQVVLLRDREVFLIGGPVLGAVLEMEKRANS